MAEIRDPVHGFVQRTGKVEKLIDTRAFQRLRSIKQLAMAHLVYPGALHTRFEHSIGTMHIAEKLARKLLGNNSEERIRKIRHAALLHDIGHGPFSHISESILKNTISSKYSDIEEIHEIISCKFIEYDTAISRLLSQNEREEVIRLLMGEGGDAFEKQIVSGPLDADKQDYLLRDSYFCGVKYGVFDLDRLISELIIAEDQGEQVLAASKDGMYAVEQFVLAKYHMHRQVYGHRIRLITDAMIVRALELGINDDQLPFLKELYEYEDNREYIRNYLEWNDIRLINEILNEENKGKFVYDFFKRLVERRLFKRVFTTRIDYEKIASDVFARFRLVEFFKVDSEKFKRKIERKVAKYLSSFIGNEIDSNYVISNVYAIKSLRNKPIKEEEKKKEDSIKIIEGNNVLDIEDISTLLHSIDDSFEERFIDIYAPIAYKDDADKKRKLIRFENEIGPLIVEAINEVMKEVEGGNNDPRKNNPANN